MLTPCPLLPACGSHVSWALVLLVVLALTPGCATVRGPARPGEPLPPPERLPVLLVHGIHDRPGSWRYLASYLREQGFTHVAAARLEPNTGRAPLEVLALQVARQAASLRARTGAERIDVVAFSMGALTTRYWLQELEGHQLVRRFISISGPHQGTQSAWLSRGAGVVQMRPGSSFLRALERSPRRYGHTQVFSFWTPFDLMIVPASSSRLPEAAEERTFPVLLHPLMMSDARVLAAVVEVLSRPSPPPTNSP